MKIKCSRCKELLDKSCFTPSQLKLAWPYCRSCKCQATKEYRERLKNGENTQKNKHYKYIDGIKTDIVLCDFCNNWYPESYFLQSDLHTSIYVCKNCKTEYNKTRLDMMLEEYIKDNETP